MQSVFDFILKTFSDVVNLMKSTVFEVYGYKVSLFWLLLSISFMGFVFTVLIPFVSRVSNSSSGAGAGKSTSERVKE